MKGSLETADVIALTISEEISTQAWDLFKIKFPLETATSDQRDELQLKMTRFLEPLIDECMQVQTSGHTRVPDELADAIAFESLAFLMNSVPTQPKRQLFQTAREIFSVLLEHFFSSRSFDMPGNNRPVFPGHCRMRLEP